MKNCQHWLIDCETKRGKLSVSDFTLGSHVCRHALPWGWWISEKGVYSGFNSLNGKRLRCVCVCVCVCLSEREREREREKEREMKPLWLLFCDIGLSNCSQKNTWVRGVMKLLVQILVGDNSFLRKLKKIKFIYCFIRLLKL